MKNTALTHIHEALGAKMVPFAGYNMPVQYEGVNAEHEIEEAKFLAKNGPSGTYSHFCISRALQSLSKTIPKI